MFPWFWIWAPNIYYPWSGAVTQDIDPNATWFSDLIEPGAGDPEIERQAFAVASYGKQLGLLTEVLLGVVAQNEPLSAPASASLVRLREIQAAIDKIKATEAHDTAQRLLSEIETLRRHGGEEFALLARRLLPLLAAPAA